MRGQGLRDGVEGLLDHRERRARGLPRRVVPDLLRAFARFLIGGASGRVVLGLDRFAQGAADHHGILQPAREQVELQPARKRAGRILLAGEHHVLALDMETAPSPLGAAAGLLGLLDEDRGLLDAVRRQDNPALGKHTGKIQWPLPGNIDRRCKVGAIVLGVVQHSGIGVAGIRQGRIRSVRIAIPGRCTALGKIVRLPGFVRSGVVLGVCEGHHLHLHGRARVGKQLADFPFESAGRVAFVRQVQGFLLDDHLTPAAFASAARGLRGLAHLFGGLDLVRTQDDPVRPVQHRETQRFLPGVRYPDL